MISIGLSQANAVVKASAATAAAAGDDDDDDDDDDNHDHDHDDNHDDSDDDNDGGDGGDDGVDGVVIMMTKLIMITTATRITPWMITYGHPSFVTWLGSCRCSGVRETKGGHPEGRNRTSHGGNWSEHAEQQPRGEM